MKEDCAQGYFADSGTSCRSGLSYGYGYLLGREERTARYVPETSSDFIDKRHAEMPEGSYTTSLFRSGVNKMAQKVGEEAR